MTERKPHVVILGVGGTIAAQAVAPTRSTGYSTFGFDADALIDSIPGIREEFDLEARQLFAIGSCRMEDHHLLEINRSVNALLEREDVDGVVITHGTDTMEEICQELFPSGIA